MKRAKLKKIGHVLKDTGVGFINDRVLKLSGALAYFTIFSIGPMLIVAIFFADIFYGRDAIEGTIYDQIKDFVGSEAAVQIQDIIRNAALSGKNTWTAIIGFITLFIGATTVFAEIQDSINLIWNLKTKPEKGWIKLILDRLLSFSIVIALGFLSLVSLLINGLLDALGKRIEIAFPELAVSIIYSINLGITIIVITSLFAIIYKVLPDARIRWRDVAVGAIVTGLLFMLGKFAIGFYIGQSNVGTAYGTAGSLVILLIWVYYSAIVLYLGAEFTKAYAVHFGRRIYPNQYAVWITHVDIEEEGGTLRQQEIKKRIENNQTGDEITVK